MDQHLPFVEALQPALPIAPESRRTDIPTETSLPEEGQGDLFAPETASREEAHAALSGLNATRALELLADHDVAGDDPGAPVVRDACRRLDGLVRPSGDVLIEALVLVGRVSASSAFAWSLRRGISVRLLGHDHRDAVFNAAPVALGYILAVVCPRQRDDHSTAGRELVRDLLLRGRSIGSQLVPDPDVRAVLAEDRHPTWLASVGVSRRVWRTGSSATGRELDVLLAQPLPLGDEQRAREFWVCLSFSTSRDGQTERRQAARRRMKQLDADLHHELVGP